MNGTKLIRRSLFSRSACCACIPKPLYIRDFHGRIKLSAFNIFFWEVFLDGKNLALSKDVDLGEKVMMIIISIYVVMFFQFGNDQMGLLFLIMMTLKCSYSILFERTFIFLFNGFDVVLMWL